MAVTTTGNVTFKVSITDTVAAGALRSSAVSGAAEIDASHKWNAGAGAALEINLVSYNKMTVSPGSPSTPVTHDLDALTSPNNESINFANVRGIYAHLDSGPAGVQMIMGASGTDAFEDLFLGGTTPTVKIDLNGIFALDRPAGAAGWVVGTNNTDLKFDFGTFSTTDAVGMVIYAGNS